MSNADFVSFAVVEEVTYATAVATPAYSRVNIRSGSLASSTAKTRSELIRQDAQSLRGGKGAESATASLAGELQYDVTGGWWQLLKASLRAGSETAATTTVSAVTFGSSKLSATGVHTGIEVGDVVRVKNSAGTVLGYFPVTIVGTNEITIVGTPSETTGLKVRRGLRIKNGTTLKSFQIEESHNDLSPVLYETGNGMVPSSYRVSVQVDNPPTWEMPMVGSHTDGSTDTATAGATYTAAPTGGVFSTLVPRVYIDGLSFCCTEFSYGWTANFRQRRCLDTNRARVPGSGKLEASGSARVYFESTDLYQKAVTDAESTVFFAQEDNAHNALVTYFPNVQWGEASKPVTGENTDVFLTMPFTAHVDTAEAITVRVSMFPAGD